MLVQGSAATKRLKNTGIGYSVSSGARLFYCEKYLQNLPPIFSLFIHSVAVYIAW